MKKRMTALLLALALLLTPALANDSPLGGPYHTDIKWDAAADMVDNARAGESEPFLILFYSHLCGYSQDAVPMLLDYAQDNGIQVYTLDAVARPGEEISTRALNLGFPLRGGYPIALRYGGTGHNIEMTSDVRSLDAFLKLLDPPPAPDGDFLLNEEGILVEYLGSQSQVVIPDRVTAIGPNAFGGQTGLRAVVIPEGVGRIGDFAFRGCSALEEVVFPSTVTDLGTSTFSGCTSLTKVDMAASGVTTIPAASFANLRSLREVTLPHGLTTIGNGAFNGCVGIRGFTVPANVTSIEKYAFNGCQFQTLRFLGSRPAMPAGEENPLNWVKAAGIYPVGDSTWGSPEALAAEFPRINWGGLPGQVSPIPARSEIDDGTLADWAADEVALAKSFGISDPISPGGFDQSATRFVFCLLATGLIEKKTGLYLPELVENMASPFSDVDHYAVKAAYMLGLVTGKGDGTFDPNGTITRQEAAAMLSRTAQYLGVPVRETAEAQFSDGGDIAAWARADVDFVAALSTPQGKTVMGSTGEGFSPLTTYSKQEAICSFLRLYQALPEA